MEEQCWRVRTNAEIVLSQVGCNVYVHPQKYIYADGPTDPRWTHSEQTLNTLAFECGEAENVSYFTNLFDLSPTMSKNKGILEN